MPAPYTFRNQVGPIPLSELDDNFALKVNSTDLAAQGGSAGVGFIQAGAGSVARTSQDKIRETVSVQDFGAKGDGVTDDTAAFNAAAATGKRVFVPYTVSGYIVNNITVFSGMEFFGENRRTQLIVSQNNAGAFLHSSGTALFDIVIKNFWIRPITTSVSGCSAYKQASMAAYSAYVTFENLETDLGFPVSYDGFFIFANWINCRDGYAGNINVSGVHVGINSFPTIADWSLQGNQTNLCRVKDSQFFRSTGGAAAIDIGWGVLWSFSNTDFENVGVPAVRARGVYLVEFDNCWFERLTANYTLVASLSVGTNQQGSKFTLKNSWGLQPGAIGFGSFGSACSIDLIDVQFAQLPSGYVLSNSNSSVGYAINVSGSGAGATTLLSGVNTMQFLGGKMLLNGAADSGLHSEIQLVGSITASKGFGSSHAIQVGTTATIIATTMHGAALAFVNASNNSGGNSGWYLVAFNTSNAQVTVLSSYTAALALSGTFTMVGSDLKLAFASGSASVSVALLV